MQGKGPEITVPPLPVANNMLGHWRSVVGIAALKVSGENQGAGVNYFEHDVLRWS